MNNVSNQFKQQLADDQRNFLPYADITLSDGTVLNLDNSDIWQGGFKIEDAVSGSNNFQIGAAIINKLDLTLNNIYDDFSEYIFEDAEVAAYVGLELPDGTIEKARKGTFAVTEASGQNSSLVALECLDNMRKFERPYSESKLVYPATLGQIIRDACTVCGVQLVSASFRHDDYVIQQRPNDEALNFREVVSCAAQIACRWARCDAWGRLELGWYDDSEISATEAEILSGQIPAGTHRIASLSSDNIALDDVVITGVKVTENNDSAQEAVSYLYGSEGYVLSIEGNALVLPGQAETVAAMVGEAVIGLQFRPMSLNILSDPTIEAGDRACVIDDKSNVHLTYFNNVTFSIDGYQEVSCQAESPARKSAQRYSQATKSYVALRNMVQSEKTARELAVERLNRALAESSGMYSTEVQQEDGSTIYYLHDKPTLAESKNVIKLTAEAIGLSVDGGKTYPYGFSIDGEMIMRIISTEGLNADWLVTGEIVVRDKDGNIIFSANMDTGQVLISGDSVKIGDTTATKAIQEAKSEAQKARTLSITLDNEYQGISTDADGNYDVFPQCKTTVTVLYGQSDVSGDCTYTVQKSAAVTGTWDAQTRTCTVTGLSADTGWVDIIASYMGVFTVTKRFNIAKVRDGSSGEPGRTYFMEASSLVVKRSKDNSIAPNFITLSAYYRDGTGTARTAYAGRFKIEETVDGYTWTTMYVSDENETSVTHSLYSALATADGQAISTADGKVIAIPRDVVELRFTLYAAGGTAQVLDMQSAAVVTDVDALTQDEVFNILTNNGEVKGIYKEGDQLYISFTYAKGGKLTLGGASNGNGQLEILDASGNRVGYIDNTGVNFKKGIFSGTLDGANIRGSTFTTTTLNETAYLKLVGGNLDFYDTDAFSGYSYAGSICAGTEEYYDIGGDETEYAIVASMSFNAAHYYTLNVGGKPAMYTYIAEKRPRTDFYGDLYSAGSANFKQIASSGTKSRIVEDTYYGDRLLYCYETPTPQFGDIGSGQLDENGECYVSIDDIFSETINPEIEYAVFLQKEGPGDLWVDSKEPAFFVVKGTPGLAFSWELKAVQKGFENLRLDDRALSDIETAEDDDLEEIFDAELSACDLETDKLFSAETEESGLEMEDINESIESVSGN